MLAKLAAGGVQVYRDGPLHPSVPEQGISMAMVSSGADTKEILDSAGLAGLFDVRVDGLIAKERGLRGKRAPDTFLAAATELHVPPGAAAVFEDALAGSRAGRAGHCVRGQRDRVGQAGELSGP